MPRRTKDAALVVLVLLNVVLLCTVLAQVFQLPRANAQPAETRGTRFLAVSGLIEAGGANALYVLDAGQQKLYSWAPVASGLGTGMVLRDIRDLRQDFSRQPTPAVPPRR
jgi:hypothetical protein